MKILNVEINNINMIFALKMIEDFIASKKPHLVITANAEIIMLAQKDNEFLKILKKADLIIPDGAGVLWAAKYYNYKIYERVTGYDISQKLLEIASKVGYTVYMLGGSVGVAQKAAKIASQMFPGINIVGTHDGFFEISKEEKIITEIAVKKPDILFVAMGAPKQEKWLANNFYKLNVPVSIGVGGTFDVMIGTIKRAPIWMQQAGLEWMYRLMRQPWRFFRMMALPKFVLLIIFGKKN